MKTMCLQERPLSPTNQTLWEQPTTVLLETHPTIREMLTTALSLAGYQPPLCLDTVPAFMDVMQTMPLWEAIALMLVDLSVPQTPVVPPLLMQWHTRALVPPTVLVLTTQPSVQRDAHSAGYPALLKPFHLHDLFSIVPPRGGRYLGRRSVQPTAPVL
jgi:DNA-binding response OmpR family regulator